MAWDGQVTLPTVFHFPFWSLKTGAGCLKEIEFDNPTSKESSPFYANGVLTFSGLLLKARRSTRTIADDSSWVQTENSLDIWRGGMVEFENPPRPRPHCFILHGERNSEPIGIVQLDDLSNTPEVFTCLLVDDEKMINEEVFDHTNALMRSAPGLYVVYARAMLAKQYLRRYWLLVLKPCGQLQQTYQRLGVAVATYRKLTRRNP
jgi:hypothetical protein